ncbi:MAG: hypothetical protein IJX39_09115 [Clostridia bacterium]|nr:hypothetical protein [Clostridia bacterium]
MPEEQNDLSPRQDGLPEDEFSDLLQSMTAMAPLLKGFLPTASDKGKPSGGGPPDGEGHHDKGSHRKGKELCDRREALLLALKPYLSPSRCAAVDYLIRLARVGDAIRALQWE